MPFSQSKKGFLPFGNLFTRPGLSTKKTGDSKGKQVQVQSRNSVIADEDFCQSPEIMEPDTSVSISLYEQLVADCLKGETFAVGDENFTDEENEEAREIRARTFINTIVAASTTERGIADVSRADKSLPHKSVSFASDLISGPGKGYQNQNKEALASRESLMVECGSDSDSDSGPVKSTGTAVVHTNTPTPNIIEKIMLCNCPAHKHCLTCQMTNGAFSLVLKESYEDLIPSPSARWVVALSSLDRAVRIWVGEHTINNPHIGPDQWQTPVSQVDEATVSALKDMINIAQGIAHIRGKRSRHVVNNLRKAVKTSDKLTSTLQKLRHTPADDKDKREKLAKRFTACKTDVKIRLNNAIALLESMHNELRVLLQKRIMPIRVDMLRNFEQSNVHWPRSSARKTRFMAEVLVNVYKGSQAPAVRLREMYAVWDKPLKIGKVHNWLEQVRKFIVFWGEWMTDVEKGLAGVAARAEVLDRRGEVKCQEDECRRGALRRKIGGLLLAG